ncbi:MAG: hypothetical protein EOO54_11305, partial [Haliea sp.]
MVAQLSGPRRSPRRDSAVGIGRLLTLRLALVPWLLGGALALAQSPADPLKSAACGQATQELEAARAAAGASAVAQQAARIEQLRD